MSPDTIKLYESLKANFLHIDNHEKAYLSRFGLNIPRFYVLIHIAQNPGMNYIDLSDRLLCTKSNTTRIMQGMIKDELISRKNDPKDGRSFQLFLTEKGEALLAQVYPGFVAQVKQLMAAFSAEEIQQYLRVSHRIETIMSPDSSVNRFDSQILKLEITEKQGKNE